MAKKIFCLKERRRIFEDRCHSAYNPFSGESDRTCYTCIAQREQAEIKQEYPDELTEEQKGWTANQLRWARIHSLLEKKKRFLEKWGEDVRPLVCESYHIGQEGMTPFISAERAKQFERITAASGFLHSLTRHSRNQTGSL